MVSIASINYDMSEEQKYRFLQNPVNYPSKPARIDIIETHMSYVFLDDTFAYKLKSLFIMSMSIFILSNYDIIFMKKKYDLINDLPLMCI